MKTLPRLLAACAVAALCAAAPARAADDSVAALIAKARARLGPDELLTQVKAVRYVGTITTSTAKPGETLQLDVVFQSPYRMRQKVVTPAGTDYTVLDGYLGWMMSQDKQGAARLGTLKTAATLHLRANVWENLSFYAGFDQVGGRIEDAGAVTLDGRPARKLTFWHDKQIRFERWFDPASGQLIQTATDDGSVIREEGELRSGGLRFPQKLITTTKGKDGATVTSTITFEKITLNEPLADKDFAMPRPTLSTPSLLTPPAPPALTPELPKAAPSTPSSNLGLPPLPPPAK
jgi:outer membrane lipoprotein-sorting protein